MTPHVLQQMIPHVLEDLPDTKADNLTLKLTLYRNQVSNPKKEKSAAKAPRERNPRILKLKSVPNKVKMKTSYVHAT